MVIKKLTVNQINQMSQSEFVECFGGIYEHSDWVAKQAWLAAPFDDFDAVLTSLANVVSQSDDSTKLALLRAHPQLSGRVSERHQLTNASQAEQKSVGLNELTSEQADWLAQYNALYYKAFGFPFIIAVKNHTQAQIFQQMENRVNNCVDDELKTALEQVDEIARIRLSQLVQIA